MDIQNLFTPATEKALAETKWNKRDVIVGAFRSKEQFEACLRDKLYYVPARWVKAVNLPVRYAALYQSRVLFGEDGCIQYFGQVTRCEPVKRKNISVSTATDNGPEDEYYEITVKDWKKIARKNESGKPIEVGEYGPRPVTFTNHFMLMHSEYYPELSLIGNEKDFIIYTGLKKMLGEAGTGRKSVNFVADKIKYALANGEITAYKEDKAAAVIKTSDYGEDPAQIFRALKKAKATR